MTERDLMRYVICKREELRLREMLYEYESVRSSARSPKISPLPSNRGVDTQLKLAADIDRIDKVTERLNQAIARTLEAEQYISVVRDLLDDIIEIKVFEQLYYYGKSISEAACSLDYSIATIYRKRENILTVAARV